jgi:hypothetical protein
MTLVHMLTENRNVLRYALTQVAHPFELVTASRIYRSSIARQAELFTQQHVDDVTDAMRHAGTSARMVQGLVRHGTTEQRAASFMRALGQAHERDSDLVGVHRATSEAMDLHNNELGIAVAREHLTATPQALEGAVLRALADGRATVLGPAPTFAPRASTEAELRAVLRDPRVLG